LYPWKRCIIAAMSCIPHVHSSICLFSTYMLNAGMAKFNLIITAPKFSRSQSTLSLDAHMSMWVQAIMALRRAGPDLYPSNVYWLVWEVTLFLASSNSDTQRHWLDMHESWWVWVCAPCTTTIWAWPSSRVTNPQSSGMWHCSPFTLTVKSGTHPITASLFLKAFRKDLGWFLDNQTLGNLQGPLCPWCMSDSDFTGHNPAKPVPSLQVLLQRWLGLVLQCLPLYQGGVELLRLWLLCLLWPLREVQAVQEELWEVAAAWLAVEVELVFPWWWLEIIGSKFFSKHCSSA